MEELNQNEIQPAKQKKNKPAGLIILIICILLAVGLASLSIFTDDPEPATTNTEKFTFERDFSTPINLRNMTSSDKKAPSPSGNYIAKIFITGVIQEENKTYNQKWLLDLIKRLEEDKNNKGIILYINSPGGSVYESDEAYLALSHYQSTHKPVWAYMGPLAASGGYYMACGTEYIVANRNTLTGSIGVIAGQSMDLTELMEKYGIKSKTFTAGRNKNMLNYNSPLTEEQEQIMQSIADECYDQFTTIVSVNRRIDKDDVKELADGRIYTANQALNLKLIDRICSFEDAVSAMKAKYQFIDVEVVDYKYTPKTSWSDIFSYAASKVSPLSQSTESKILDMISTDIKYPAYLYR